MSEEDAIIIIVPLIIIIFALGALIFGIAYVHFSKPLDVSGDLRMHKPLKDQDGSELVPIDFSDPRWPYASMGWKVTLDDVKNGDVRFFYKLPNPDKGNNISAIACEFSHEYQRYYIVPLSDEMPDDDLYTRRVTHLPDIPLVVFVKTPTEKYWFLDGEWDLISV